MRKHKIFLSHITEERKVAMALKQCIKELYLNAVEIFVSSDIMCLRSGTKWLDCILEELNNADIVLVLASDDSITHPWVNFEAGGGCLLKKPVIPLCIRGMSVLTLPEPLHSLQAVNLEDKAGFINLFKSISDYCDLGVPKQSDIEEFYDKTMLLIKELKTNDEKKAEIKSMKETSPSPKDNFFEESTTVFFSRRVAKAFPSIRGLQWINDPKAAVYRLTCLLKAPLTFSGRLCANPELVARRIPIWCFRGHSNMGIKSYQQISESKVLINNDELKIDKIAVFRSNDYYREFIYVETLPEKTVDICDTTQDEIKRMIDLWGYANEEYGWLNGKIITRSEYDDGAALIDGQIVDASDAKLRIRYLSKYNFIICAQFAPYNSSKFDLESEDYLNGILQGSHKLEDFLEDVMLKLTRHRMDE